MIAAGEGPAGGGYQAVNVGSLDFAFCVAPTHPLTRLDQPLQRGDLIHCNAIVVGDSARTSSDRTVGLLAGQPRIAVPSMAAKIACQVEGLGHGHLPRACIAGELARGSLVELATEEPRAPETFWLAWKTGSEGRALRWWRDRLDRPLVPALLPRTGTAAS